MANTCCGYYYYCAVLPHPRLPLSVYWGFQSVSDHLAPRWSTQRDTFGFIVCFGALELGSCQPLVPFCLLPCGNPRDMTAVFHWWLLLCQAGPHGRELTPTYPTPWHSLSSACLSSFFFFFSLSTCLWTWGQGLHHKSWCTHSLGQTGLGILYLAFEYIADPTSTDSHSSFLVYMCCRSEH